jgi:hypothetical protein
MLNRLVYYKQHKCLSSAFGVAVIVSALVVANPLALPVQAAPVGADALVLINSHSARYLDFKHFIQPYLDNFGFPYTVQDISTNAPGPGLANCAVIIIGHSQLDTNRTYLSAAAQATLSLAVSNGVGLVNFDNDLSSGASPRYQFVQDVFGFSYGSSASGSSVGLPPTEPASQMHYISARHAANDSITLHSSLSLPGITVPAGATTLATIAGKPLVAVAKYGQGRAVQWESYEWMTTTVLGPLEGLDDLVWRGVVWAARKPFLMRGLPNLVVMRMDDASGPFWWAHVADQIGFKPWIGLFLNSIDSTEATDLSGLVTSGKATAYTHSFNCCSSFFFFNHSTETAYSDSVMSNNYAVATQWHASHNVPMSKALCTHYSEMGVNAFAGLKAWGVEYFQTEVVPGTVEYASPGAPWVVAGPYRLYENTQPGQIKWPVWYADFLTVPSHPEFDGQFFNVYVEVRDDSSCNEWCPANGDVAGSIGRGSRQVKRALDSMALGQLYTHEWYVVPIPESSNQTPISSNNWSAILQGITNSLGSYTPNYVTMDYACQYIRATRTSRLVGGAFDEGSGLVTANFTGKTDLDTGVYVFVGADSAISSSFGSVRAFSGPVTNTVATLVGRPQAPAVISGPVGVATNAGATVALTMTAVGTAPLSYQWLLNLAPLANGGSIAGATTPTLTLTGVNPTNSGDYCAVITNLAGSVTGSVATLTVVLPPHCTSIGLMLDSNPLLSFDTVSDLTYRIDASTDLVNWSALANVPGTNGTLRFIDMDATNYSQRFYRAVWVP